MPAALRSIAVALVLVVAGAGAYQAGRWLAPPPERVGTVLQNPQDVSDLELTLAADGSRIVFGDLAARSSWTLVFFGFVDCPDVCPLTMARLAETYRNLGEPEGLQVVMITVDPEQDDAERLRRYVSAFHPAFDGLGGTTEDIAAAAKRFFIGYSGTGTEIVHTEAVGLVDDTGRLRAVYGQGKVGAIGDDLADLLAGERL
ncbi:MAG: SCO family protein [Trueperaceae bacterium]|nr:SCO family protein [Trueperaceae bacterium]